MSEQLGGCEARACTDPAVGHDMTTPGNYVHLCATHLDRRKGAWTCVECDDRITDYRPGVCHEDGTYWLICGPCFTRYEASFLPPETDRWPDLKGTIGDCGYCGRETRLRIEPFGGKDACKPCWEQICYGETA